LVSAFDRTVRLGSRSAGAPMASLKIAAMFVGA
jgi:hypothetical protein